MVSFFQFLSCGVLIALGFLWDAFMFLILPSRPDWFPRDADGEPQLTGTKRRESPRGYYGISLR